MCCHLLTVCPWQMHTPLPLSFQLKCGQQPVRYGLQHRGAQGQGDKTHIITGYMGLLLVQLPKLMLQENHMHLLVNCSNSHTTVQAQMLTLACGVLLCCQLLLLLLLVRQKARLNCVVLLIRSCQGCPKLLFVFCKALKTPMRTCAVLLCAPASKALIAVCWKGSTLKGYSLAGGPGLALGGSLLPCTPGGQHTSCVHDLPSTSIKLLPTGMAATRSSPKRASDLNFLAAGPFVYPSEAASSLFMDSDMAGTLPPVGVDQGCMAHWCPINSSSSSQPCRNKSIAL